MNTAERAAHQRGFFLDHGYTEAQIADFEALMTTLPAVRPQPRYGCATDLTDDNPTTSTDNGSRL